jgi:hypothetical protein
MIAIMAGLAEALLKGGFRAATAVPGRLLDGDRPRRAVRPVMERHPMRQHPLIMAAIAVPLLLAACGASASGPGVASGGGKPSATSPAAKTSGSDGGLAFARCMRANGVNIADPEPGHALQVPDPSTGPQEKKALDACRQLLPNGGAARPASAVDLAKVREFAKCMRANGVDMPDPDTNGSISLQSQGDPTKVAAAAKVCQSKLPGRK